MNITERQKTLIVNNVIKACKDSKALDNAGYRFLSGCSGFIAHYNKVGFQSEFETPGELKQAILMNRDYNQYRNFRPGDVNYEYYSGKAEVYNRIVESI